MLWLVPSGVTGIMCCVPAIRHSLPDCANGLRGYSHCLGPVLLSNTVCININERTFSRYESSKPLSPALARPTTEMTSVS